MNPRAGRAVLAAIIPLVAGAAVPAPRAVHGVFGSVAPSVDTGLTAASLQPPVSPRPVVVAGASAVALEWSPVTSTAGGSIVWTVRRSSSSGTSSVCGGAGAVVSSPVSVSCTDSTVQRGVTYSYTVQPQLWRFSTPTWNLPEGPASDATALPGVVFASAGSVVTTVNTGVVDVPYPSGTEAGDLLLLVVVNGRNRAPTRTTGWTDVASSGIGGVSDFHLYVGQRIADAATSAQVTIDGRAGGAALQVLRYDSLPGAATPVVRAVQPVIGDTATAAVQLTPTPDVATMSNATVVSVVAVRNPGDLVPVAGTGWTRRMFSSASPGGVPLAWALADRFVVQAGAVSSPTWQQAGSPVSRWIYAGSAFG